jgi:hypothetical protein
VAIHRCRLSSQCRPPSPRLRRFTLPLLEGVGSEGGWNRGRRGSWGSNPSLNDLVGEP